MSLTDVRVINLGKELHLAGGVSLQLVQGPEPERTRRWRFEREILGKREGEVENSALVRTITLRRYVSLHVVIGRGEHTAALIEHFQRNRLSSCGSTDRPYEPPNKRSAMIRRQRIQMPHWKWPLSNVRQLL